MGVHVTGTIVCPKCNTVINLSNPSKSNNQKSTSSFRKKIENFKKDVKKIFEGLIKLIIAGIVIYFIYWLIRYPH